MAEPYSVYDTFAWFYRRGWGEEFHRRCRPVLERHVFPRLPENARVLDLCCGSGDLSALLVERGYSVTGIDGSCEMLACAREKAPGAVFLHADARAFDLPPEFDAVLSTFDSLNHVLELEELALVFANVHRALRGGGLFVFDLNMAEAFTTLWRGSWSSFEEQSVGITRGSYNAESGIGRADVTVFRREENGLWSRSDIAVLERCYSEGEISAAIQRAGFRDLEGRDAYELGMQTDVALGRKFFFAIK